MNIKEPDITIRLSDFFKNSISSRDAIKTIFDFQKEISSGIILDFEGIEFMTRSAAHQLLKEISRIESSSVSRVKLIAVSPSVKEMMRIVSRSTDSSKKLRNPKQDIVLNSSSEFQNILFSF